MSRKKLHGAAKAAHDKRLARERGGGKKMAKKKKTKKRSGGGGKRRRSGARRGKRAWLSRNEALAALAVSTGYGYLQHRAEKAKGDEMKWFKEAPTVTPLGRAGTVAAVAGGVAYATSGTVSRVAKVIAIGTGALALAQFGRRGFEMYSDKDTKSIMAGEDEASMYLGNGDDEDADSISGELDLVEYG